MKVVHKDFPLDGQAGRTALILGVLDGTVQGTELKAAVARDVEPRARRKPVHVLGQRYDTVTAAARAAVKLNCGGHERHNDVEAMRVWIAKLCNQDCWEGYYWCE